MKKMIICAAALICALAATAQTPQEMQALKDRMEELSKLVSPKQSGIASVDALQTACEKAAEESAAITPILQNMYDRCNTSNGEQTGVKPSLEELASLSARIVKEAEAVGKASQSVAAASKEVSSLKNPMKLKAATGAMKYSKDALALLAEQSALQMKIVTGMIQAAGQAEKQ